MAKVKRDSSSREIPYVGVDMDGDGFIDTIPTVNKNQLFGKTLADRPDPGAVRVGTTFTIVNAALDTWISNGEDEWVAI